MTTLHYLGAFVAGWLACMTGVAVIVIMTPQPLPITLTAPATIPKPCLSVADWINVKGN